MRIVKNRWLLCSVFMSLVIVANGQSKTNLKMDPGEAISVCHATGSKENPYETMMVKDNGVAHRNHPADIIPEPINGCPGPSGGGSPEPVPEPLTILLFGSGIAAVGHVARRLKKRRQ